ncbi:MAG: 2-amino-4-hydroxy-6-hydroxymethyldihydropteridine diphosphokinase [Gemmatimonadales bacterium]
MGTERVAIALGSNLGDRATALDSARAAIAALPLTALVAASPVEETDAIGPVRQGPFLNQMLLVDTSLAPRALLEALLSIERDHGRERRERWGPRTLDCDIVLFGSRSVSERDLTIPHPELKNRDFWRRELKALDVQLPVG